MNKILKNIGKSTHLLKERLRLQVLVNRDRGLRKILAEVAFSSKKRNLVQAVLENYKDHRFRGLLTEITSDSEKRNLIQAIVENLKDDRFQHTLIQIISDLGKRNLVQVVVENPKEEDAKLSALLDNVVHDAAKLWIATKLVQDEALQQSLSKVLRDPTLRDALISVVGDTKLQQLVAATAQDSSQKSLTLMLINLLQHHAHYSQHFQRVLSTLMLEPNLALSIHFANWLSTQPPEFQASLADLLSQDQLTIVFDHVLREWNNQLTLDQAKSLSVVREIYVSELFPDIGQVTIPVGVIHEESHHANHADMVYVCAIAAVIKAQKIFEFGTYQGQTTCGLASISEDVQVTTLNLPPEQDSRYGSYIGRLIKTFPHQHRITQLFEDSRQFDPAPYAHQMDYIFIDADHSYEGVSNDTAKALEMLKPGGVMVWHDYAAKSPGVYRFIQEFSQTRPVFRLRNTCLIVYVDGVDASRFTPNKKLMGLENVEYSPDKKFLKE